MVMWDPDQYHQFAGERARPFFELLARVGATDPGLVADLGCGPGELTAALADRWPGADVIGVDSSPEMIRSARALPGPERLSFELADLREWQPARPAGVIVSNAALQWVPDQLDVLSRWPDMLAPGGWLAFQVPGNFDQPSHQILSELASSPRWHPLLRDVELNRQAARPAEYLDLLARLAATLTPGKLPTCMCCRGPIPSWTGTRAPDSGRCWPRSPPGRPVSSWPSTARGPGRPTPRRRTAPCCRSGGSSSSPPGASACRGRRPAPLAPFPWPGV